MAFTLGCLALFGSAFVCDPSFTEDFETVTNAVLVEGLHGQALYVEKGSQSGLSYDCREILNREEGSLSFWHKPDSLVLDTSERRVFFQTGYTGPRGGSGALIVWSVAGVARGDVSDDADAYVVSSRPLEPGVWHHIAFTWTTNSSVLYVDGRQYGMYKSAAYSPLVCAYGLSKKGRKFRVDGDAFNYARMELPSLFTLGSNGNGESMCGAMDDFKLWKVALRASDVRRLFESESVAGATCSQADVDYAAMVSTRLPNQYEDLPLDQGGLPGKLKLVTKWEAGEIVPTNSSSFRVIGACRLGQLDGRRYLEADSKENSRVAFRFGLSGERLYCFEIDYPDDKIRTCDVIIQASRKVSAEAVGSGQCGMQVGYATGAPYVNTRKVLTHRCILWSPGDDVSLILMTAREGCPAAVTAIRVFAVESAALPMAKIVEPPANDDGWRRSFALYYEDPALYADFARPWATVSGALEPIDRLAATMKYTGQNILCYPAVWYQGLVDDDYMPRPHPPAYRKALYAAFDREGLGVMPTMNPNEISVPYGLITAKSVKNGSLHASPVNILATGEPNPGGWHSTPPNYNVTHPEVQRQVLAWVEDLIAEGKDHPSFKGLCLHVTTHSPLWFGDENSGYNDYTVEKFLRETGLRLPDAIDRHDPLRGKAYAAWIHENHAEDWQDWRCRQVRGFWQRISDALKCARPDLKLMINFFVTVHPGSVDYLKPDATERTCRRAGFDKSLFADMKNLIVSVCVMPADWRWMQDRRYKINGNEDSGAQLLVLKNRQREKYLIAEDFSLLKESVYPWVNQHDRYWESPVGDRRKSKDTLDCSWMDEINWRVSTINPSGRNALRQYAVPLRFGDVLACSKGGYLVGTYGSEEVLVPWMQAFRALPAVKMAEFFREGFVVGRKIRFKGKNYYYVVNTDETEVDVRIPGLEKTVNIVTGARPLAVLHLKAYELVSFKEDE